MVDNMCTCGYCGDYVEKRGVHFHRIKSHSKCKKRFKLDKNGSYGMIEKKGVL